MWNVPSFNGGTPVIDYLIMYAQGSGTYVNLTSVTVLNYNLTGVTSGSTYRFMIRARNSYGYSIESNEVIILAAQIPSQPSAPITTFRPDNVTI